VGRGFTDKNEAHVQALAEGIRGAFAASRSDEDVNQLVEAAMGDEVIDEPDFEPTDPAIAGKR